MVILEINGESLWLSAFALSSSEILSMWREVEKMMGITCYSPVATVSSLPRHCQEILLASSLRWTRCWKISKQSIWWELIGWSISEVWFDLIAASSVECDLSGEVRWFSILLSSVEGNSCQNILNRRFDWLSVIEFACPILPFSSQWNWNVLFSHFCVPCQIYPTEFCGFHLICLIIRHPGI